MGGFVFGLFIFSVIYFIGIFSTEIGSDKPSLVTALNDLSMGGIAWFFMIPGMIIALLIGALLPLLVDSIYIDYRDRTFIWIAKGRKQTDPPSDLSAAAVSVSRSREVTSRTLGTIVIEMCQRGMLRITPVVRAAGDPSGSRQEEQYDYRLTVGSQSEFNWERELCDSMRDREVTPESFKSTMESRKRIIGKQLGAYLVERGLFNSNPISGFRWLFWLRSLGIVLMVGGSVASVAVGSVVGSVFTTIAMIFILALMGLFYAIILWACRHQLKLAEKSSFNERGFEEFLQWLSFRTTMWEQDRPAEDEEHSRPYPFLSYAFALGVDKPWMYSGIAETLFPDDTVTASDSIRTSDSRGMFRRADAVFVGWIAADYVTGGAGLSGTSGGLDFDFDFDFDLDI